MKYAAALLIFASSSVLAGGTAFNTTIIEFTDKGNEEYRLELLYPIQPSSPQKITLHLRHKPNEIGAKRPKEISLDAYRNCVAKLHAYFAKGEKFLFGEFGNGIAVLRENPGEYQSNTLVEYGGICYSFASPV